VATVLPAFQSIANIAKLNIFAISNQLYIFLIVVLIIINPMV